jgi:hypothetical protein
MPSSEQSHEFIMPQANALNDEYDDYTLVTSSIINGSYYQTMNRPDDAGTFCRKFMLLVGSNSAACPFAGRKFLRRRNDRKYNLMHY